MGLVEIMNISDIAKPEYVLRPHQIGRRLWCAVNGRRKEMKTVRLPWGLKLTVDVSDSLGWSIYTRAIYETVVTETLWRLTEPGDSVVDGGANIGYMTSVLGAKTGRHGRVYCFEPHPEVFLELQENVRAWKGSNKCGLVSLYQAALGERDLMATLHVPEWLAINRGVSSIEHNISRSGSKDVCVRVMSLDNVIQEDENLGVVKLDVEGYELSAIRGMQRLLSQRRVKHVVFEEGRDFPAPTHLFLRDLGYKIFGLEHRFSGIRCVPDGAPHPDPIGTPNYVATTERGVVSRLETGIWHSFGPARMLSL